MKKNKSLKQNTIKHITPSYMENINQECLNKFNNMKCDKKSIEKEYVSRYKFKTNMSNNIKITLIRTAEKCINREYARTQIEQYIMYPFAYEIERGLFEFSLIHTIGNKIQDHYIDVIYLDKLHDICANLDVNNKKIKNKTLYPMIMKKEISPYFVAFLSPDQMHPNQWIDVIKKQHIRNEAINSFQTTDIYKCAKCGERKFKITEIQLRCADENTSKIIQCLVCFHTFIK